MKKVASKSATKNLSDRRHQGRGYWSRIKDLPRSRRTSPHGPCASPTSTGRVDLARTCAKQPKITILAHDLIFAMNKRDPQGKLLLLSTGNSHLPANIKTKGRDLMGTLRTTSCRKLRAWETRLSSSKVHNKRQEFHTRHADSKTRAEKAG